MEEWFTKTVEEVTEKYGLGMMKPRPKCVGPLYAPFRLPIQCMPADKQHKLSDIIVNDLELVRAVPDIGTQPSRCMYDCLFQPSHTFSHMMLDQWKLQYTSDVTFLQESQEVVRGMKDMNYSPDACDCSGILQIWKDTKESPQFLEHYGYLDWKVLVELNRSSSILQSLACANVLSPLLSLLLPLLFLAIPFLILKIQGLPITFDVYISILKDIAKNHFIGKAIVSFENWSPDKMVYLMMTLFFYGMQIYQNIHVCQRFYRNFQKANQHLLDMRSFLQRSAAHMVQFVALHGKKTSYQPFCRDLVAHTKVIQTVLETWKDVRPFSHNAQKMVEVGTILKHFYELHDNVALETSIRYCIGFEGYLNNMSGLYDNLSQCTVNPVEIQSDADVHLLLKDQIYPLIARRERTTGSETELEFSGGVVSVSNTCHMNKNMLLTGPNASGKTTLLKTTMINVIFAQQVGLCYCSGGTLTPYTHLHSYLNIPDTSERDSLFQAEARRCKDILDVIHHEGDGGRHFCIFDELYSGTNPVEASKAARAFLVYLARFPHVHFMLTTHYVNICHRIRKDQKLEKVPSPGRQIRTMKMDVTLDKLGNMHYTYRMVHGVSRIQGAITVLKELEYPQDILEEFARG